MPSPTQQKATSGGPNSANAVEPTSDPISSQPARQATRPGAAESRSRFTVADEDSAGGDQSGDAEPRSLANLLEGEDLDDLFSGDAAGEFEPLIMPTIDAEKVRAHGIRRFDGRHVTLYTDLPEDADVAELTQVFDQAIPQWCSYFEIDPAKTADWRMVGYLMSDKAKFDRAGLLPADLPPFLHGFQRGSEFWLNEQPTAYYRRHLLLHEGTHAFMQWALGGCGPPWYMEGTAELLSTHVWQEGRLALNHFPRSKEETAYWGRIKVIKDETKAGRALSIEQITRYDTRAHLQLEPYAWCWAAAAFFDGHPRYRSAFRDLRRFARDQGFGFSNRFYDSLASDWSLVQREWQNYIVMIEYGFDVAREAIDPRHVVALPTEGASITIQADRGWQSSGFRLAAGQTYRIEASGRYQVGDRPKPWWCEPGGVTIQYHRGLPLGILLGAIVDQTKPVEGLTPLVRPDLLSTSGTATIERDGTLFLRINESASGLHDNAGELQVRVTPVVNTSE